VGTDEDTPLDRVSVKIRVTLDWKEHMLTGGVKTTGDDHLARPPVLDRAAAKCTFTISVPESNAVLVPGLGFNLDCECVFHLFSDAALYQHPDYIYNVIY